MRRSHKTFQIRNVERVMLVVRSLEINKTLWFLLHCWKNVKDTIPANKERNLDVVCDTSTINFLPT